MTTKMPTPRPSDETLVAYADDMLDAEAARAVASYLETDADARELVEAFRRSGAIAAEAYSDVMAATVPDRLLRTVLETPLAAGPPQQPGNVVPFSPRGARRPLSMAFVAPLAASVLLALGAFAGYRYASPLASGVEDVRIAIGPVPAKSPLAELLDTKASHDSIDVANTTGSRTELMAVATFVDRNGRYCREFEATGGPAPAAGTGAPLTAAVACRNKGGEWSIEGAVHLAGGSGPSLGEFSPASGKSYSAVEGVLTSLGAKPALAADDEKRIIARGWRQGD